MATRNRRTLEEQIAQAQKELEQKDARIKELLGRQRSKADKDRTNRLCRRGGLVEKLLPGLAVITDGQFETFVEKILLSGDAEKALAGLVAQVPTKPQNDTDAYAKEAAPNSESGNDSGHDGGNAVTETASTVTHDKPMQNSAPAAAVSNGNSNGGANRNHYLSNARPANHQHDNGANGNRNGGNAGRQT